MMNTYEELKAVYGYKVMTYEEWVDAVGYDTFDELLKDCRFETVENEKRTEVPMTEVLKVMQGEIYADDSVRYELNNGKLLAVEYGKTYWWLV